MAAPDNYSYVSHAFISHVLYGSKAADVSMPASRNSDAFMAGTVHGFLSSWQRIAAVTPHVCAQKVLKVD